MPKLCSVPACGRPHTGNGFCRIHYMRDRRGSDLNKPIQTKKFYTRPGEPMRFVQEVALLFDGDECLPWPFGKGTGGYGSLMVDRRLRVASRYICELAHGAPPSAGAEAAHSCNNGHQGCVNPRHLSWKTVAENMQDKIDNGTTLRGELNPSNVLSEDQVREIRRLKGTIGAKKIGARFGVCETTVLYIHQRKKWAWLED